MISIMGVGDRLTLGFDSPEECRAFAARLSLLGTRVRKRIGSSWHGTIVGIYTTEQTPNGLCVESEREPGSVQIYPEHALEKYEE